MALQTWIWLEKSGWQEKKSSLKNNFYTLSQPHLFFKQYQWQFNVEMYNVCKVPMENLPLKNLMKSSTFYNQTVSFNFYLTF